MTNEENEGDRNAAYLEIKDGEIADGVVVADLDGEEEGKYNCAAPISHFHYFYHIFSLHHSGI